MNKNLSSMNLQTQAEVYETVEKELQYGNSLTAYTSGSTGAPKQISLPMPLVLRSAHRTVNFFNINSSSHLHSCISFKFIGGKMMIARSQTAGCWLSFEEPSLRPLESALKNRKESADDTDEDITLLSVVPVQMDFILENLEFLPNIQNFLIGGSSIDESLRKRISKAGINAWESYGMTETASHIAIRRITLNPEPFRPLPGINISTDSRGCLCISEDSNLPYPINVVTNDLVKINDDGSFEILGRIDDIINTGGIKVHPVSIEQILKAYISLPFYIIGVPDEQWGEAITLVGESPHTEEEYRNIISTVGNDILPKRLHPKRIVILNKFPRAESGKPMRPTFKDIRPPLP